MNSRQRRQHKKRWQYQVTTVGDYDDYVKMWDWLASQHGIRNDRCGWREVRGWEEMDMKVTWYFVRAKDATFFALRWL